MTYGLDNYILDPPFSLLISIFQFLGICLIGKFFLNFYEKKIFIIKNHYKNCFYPIVGNYSILLIGHIFIFINLGKIFLYCFSYLILFLGILSSLIIFQNILKKKVYNFFDIENFLLTLILFGLFLISISPVTHADSLDYHINGAINLINTGHFHREILPMHDHLVSLGEIIISLGLILGAEQLGSLIQYGSLFSLIPIFNQLKNKSNSFLIFILITPITLFLVSSPKPQILYSISTLIIFSILIYIDKKKIEKFDYVLPFLVTVLFINVIVKYSFILSSFLIYLFIIYICWKRSKLITLFFTSVIIFVFLYIPIWNFRYVNFGTVFPDLILSPLPINLYAFKNHHDLLSGGSIKILSVILPKNLAEFSHTYGPIILLFFLLINKKISNYKIPSMLVIFFILGVFFYGSNLSRFLYEGFLWFTFLIYLISSEKKITTKIFKISTFVQSILILIIMSFFIANISIGSLSKEKRDVVMRKYADGYMISEWANKKLEKNDKLISYHRSISLFNVKTYSDIFTWHLDPKDSRSKLYSNFIKKNKINKILFHGKEKDFYPFENCLGRQLYFGENVGRKTGRNPFSKADFYNGWIFELNYEKLPECLTN